MGLLPIAWMITQFEAFCGMKLVNDRRNAGTKICLFTGLSPTHYTWTAPAANPALQSKNIATDHLRYDTAIECVDVFFNTPTNATLGSTLFKTPQRSLICHYLIGHHAN
jgi:hypothetical protein